MNLYKVTMNNEKFRWVAATSSGEAEVKCLSYYAQGIIAVKIELHGNDLILETRNED